MNSMISSPRLSLDFLGRQAFDRILIAVIPLIALLVALLAWASPSLLIPILVLDLWLLGYHHVIATFTRTAFDGASLRRYWHLNFLLPIGILLTLLLLGDWGGAELITTIYIHWQLFHYIRQSEGISKSFAARQPDRALPHAPWLRLAFYWLPAMSFLQMASESTPKFLGFPLWLPQLPESALIVGWMASAIIFVGALWTVAQAVRRGQACNEYVAYLTSHFIVFVVAYAVFAEITLSWLMANIWHNAQYLAFVWKSNQARFKGQVDPDARFLSTICMPQNLWMYFTVCLLATYLFYNFIAYGTMGFLEGSAGASALVAAAVVYQTINFHHYIVDAIIWRRR